MLPVSVPLYITSDIYPLVDIPHLYTCKIYVSFIQRKKQVTVKEENSVECSVYWQFHTSRILTH